jgi:transcriptional regulator with XRE-family HTH domain
MPRPNQPRSIASEHSLARRIAYEREKRGMSYEGLASRMTRVGCPIQASGVYKIERADPPRRITVDELVAFAEVFATPVQDLLLPPEMAGKQHLIDLWARWEVARVESSGALEREGRAWTAVRDYVAEHPELSPALREVLTEWSTGYAGEADRQEAVERWLWLVTDPDIPSWRHAPRAEEAGN